MRDTFSSVARFRPNHHALVRRFGLFDRFFVNAEVSSQGHIWSTAAYVTDYGKKTVPSAYAEKRVDVDGEESGEPERGFLWTLANRSGVPSAIMVRWSKGIRDGRSHNATSGQT